MLKELTRKRKKRFDVTLYQTPEFRQMKGFKEVYRMNVEESNHTDCLENMFKLFNVSDRIPNDYCGRYVGTGDIVLIDEGRSGQHYYQLQPGGWMKINRIHIR
jgi:hypothetical protein